MMTQTGQYALRAMDFLAACGDRKFHLVREVSAQLGAPQQYLSKVLHVLARQGMLKSQRGRLGGFRLSRKPEEITLFEILDPLEDLGRYKNCILGKESCEKQSICRMHGMWAEIRDRYLNFLKETTLAQLSQN